MKLLAWDTSSKSGALVALEWKDSPDPQWNQVQLMSEFIIDVELTHSERLLWGIHQTLKSLRWEIEDIDVFGVGTGPGSFTGLRVGITTARTLAHTLRKPLVGVSSLAALARPVAMHFSQKSQGSKTCVIATMDACKGELFALWGTAKLVASCVRTPDLWSKGVEEKVIEPPVLIKSIKRKFFSLSSSFRWIAIGTGRQRYLEDWNGLSHSKEIPNAILFPDKVQGRYLGLLVWEAFYRGKSEEVLNVHPHYLRASNAELRLKNG